MMKMMLIEDLNDDDNEDDNYDINDDDDESEGSWVVSYNLCSIISHLTPTTFIKLPFDGQLIFSLDSDDEDDDEDQDDDDFCLCLQIY